MASIHRADPGMRFEIYTNAPQWFFSDSLGDAFGFHCLRTDIGMVQLSPFRTDTRATLHDLKRFLPFNRDQIEKTARDIKAMACRLVICDIAPMGIAVAHKAGIPSVLIENFTWDWIYRGYPPTSVAFDTYIEYLAAYFKKASYHIQTEPICNPSDTDLRTGPAARKTRKTATVIRRELGIGPQSKMIMLTFGGVPDNGDYVAAAQKAKNVHFIIPGNFHNKRSRANITFLPYRSEFFHPDLVNASDAIIGKAGYSTIAEVYHAGKPYGYISRPDSRESPVLTRFIEKHLAGIPVTNAELKNGTWTAKVPVLLDMPPRDKPPSNGADEIAAFILNIAQ